MYLEIILISLAVELKARSFRILIGLYYPYNP